jgi:hypothetical protein
MPAAPGNTVCKLQRRWEERVERQYFKAIAKTFPDGPSQLVRCDDQRKRGATGFDRIQHRKGVFTKVKNRQIFHKKATKKGGFVFIIL